MNSIYSITVKDLSKKFKIPHQKQTTFFQNFVGLITRRMDYEEFWVLKDISFDVNAGETLGIIGRNGSGKSTMLKMLARVLYPDSGSIVTRGKVASFLEMGVGFQPELSAAENVFIYASILGMSRRETQKLYEDIFEFAELKRFENMKLKNYSSGMTVRLAFSVAIQARPDIILIDEVLAVGDEAFQKKCIAKIKEFQLKGKTIVFVSHSLDAVRAICKRAILLDKGSIMARGKPEYVIERYHALLASQKEVAAI